MFFQKHAVFQYSQLRMQDFFFYLFAAMTLLPALGMIVSRNPVNSAMYLILSLLGVAGFFVGLETYFLAALQILVYAGAVVVLFLFIIMLLDVDQAKRKVMPLVTIVASILGGAVLIYGVWSMFTGNEALPELELSAEYAGSSVAKFGHSLFGKYMLPFQVAGYLLLVAMIGVIWLSKRPDGEGYPETITDEEGASE